MKKSKFLEEKIKDSQNLVKIWNSIKSITQERDQLLQQEKEKGSVKKEEEQGDSADCSKDPKPKNRKKKNVCMLLMQAEEINFNEEIFRLQAQEAEKR